MAEDRNDDDFEFDREFEFTSAGQDEAPADEHADSEFESPRDDEPDDPEARAQAERDARADHAALIRRAYSGGLPRHPASTDSGHLCPFCGRDLDEVDEDDEAEDDDDEVNGNPALQSAARHDDLHTQHPLDEK